MTDELSETVRALDCAHAKLTGQGVPQGPIDVRVGVLVGLYTTRGRTVKIVSDEYNSLDATHKQREAEYKTALGKIGHLQHLLAECEAKSAEERAVHRTAERLIGAAMVVAEYHASVTGKEARNET